MLNRPLVVLGQLLHPKKQNQRALMYVYVCVCVIEVRVVLLDRKIRNMSSSKRSIKTTVTHFAFLFRVTI